MFSVIERWIDAGFLKLAKGDPYQADLIREKWSRQYDSAIRWAFIPLVLTVLLRGGASADVGNASVQQDQNTAIKAFATRFIDSYLKGPTNPDLLHDYCIKDVALSNNGEMKDSPVPPGGHSTGASSALPGKTVNGFQTWSVVVDTQIPKASQSLDTFYLPLQVDISIDRSGLFCAFTLPHSRTERPPGKPVELDASFSVTTGPLYDTVNGFLTAMLTGQGLIGPFIADGSNIRAANPPRFVSVSIQNVRANSDLAMAQNVPPKADGIEVNARITAQLTNGVLMPMDYPLSMSVAAGHWQVNAINDSPNVLTPEGDPDLQSPTPATATTTTKAKAAPPASNASPQEGS
ncbi:conjugal transfer protein [Mycobacteroides abscessus]|uniref:conjugal transfer protein n=1 Tax=Mycobacteroides abscessus TaxID=36809 RepID=UPI0021052613|nr:conjugal transfer protein [Mycobacteroides abscessus]